MLGDLKEGRPNLGPMTHVAVYRLMQYTLRDVLIREFGVEKADRARDGDIIVALVDGEATVKRLGKSGGDPALLPANPRYKPIMIKGGRLITAVLMVVGLGSAAFMLTTACCW